SDYAQLLLDLRDDGSGSIAPILRAEVAGWRQVSARLSRGRALLTYLVGDSTTLVFVVTPDTLRVLDLRVSRGALVPVIDFARGVLGQRAGTAQSPWRAPMRRLYQSLFAPIEE